MELKIKKVKHFKIDGHGSNPDWEKTEWQTLTRIGAGQANYRTQAKALWSKMGIFFLIDCADRVLTCTKTSHYAELYLEDVFEIFLWPDESEVVYLEYEISPLGYELPLLVPNTDGKFHGWLPFLAIMNRKILSQTIIRGGEKKPLAKADGWRAEIFIPFRLLIGLKNYIPVPGSVWRANMCRIDYDENPRSLWSWVPEVGENFHNCNAYGKFIFVE